LKQKVGNRHADHVPSSIRKKLALTSPTSGGRSVGTVGSRTQAMEFSFFYVALIANRLFLNQTLNFVVTKGTFHDVRCEITGACVWKLEGHMPITVHIILRNGKYSLSVPFRIISGNL
jgi:hypothetical protein